MSVERVRKLVTTPRLAIALVALLIGVGLLRVMTASADQLPMRSIQLNHATPSLSDTYTLGFDVPKNETLGSVTLQFCAESPLIGQPCSLPAGMDISGATLSAQSGTNDFSILGISGTTITLTRTAGLFGPGALSFTFDSITNPSSPGSYFGRILTYASTDGSGGYSDYGGLAFAINNAVNISTVVPPYLYFCTGVSITAADCSTASGDQIDFGDFSTAVASVAQSQMVAETNADTGYFIAVSGNTLTSGVNTIPGLAATDVSRPGVSQFGMNLVANNDPQVGQNPSGSGSGAPAVGYGTPNLYKFVNGDTVASSPLPDAEREYTTSYVANIAKGQAPGVYVTTLTYIATGGF